MTTGTHGGRMGRAGGRWSHARLSFIARDSARELAPEAGERTRFLPSWIRWYLDQMRMLKWWVAVRTARPLAWAIQLPRQMAICRGKSTFAAAKGPATTRILTRLNMAQLVILAAANVPDFSAQVLPGQLPRQFNFAATKRKCLGKIDV